MKKSAMILQFGAVAALASACGGNQQPSRASDMPSDYLKAKPIIETYCLACHSGAAPSGGLGLAAYPFASTRGGSQAEILDRIVVRMTSSTSPMPPAAVSPRPGQGEIQVFESWQRAGR